MTIDPKRNDSLKRLPRYICFLLLIGLKSSVIAELAEPGELYTGPEYQKAFSNPEDNPDLPNVLIMGDSISIGYTIEVRKLLTAKADVFRIKTNGRNSAYGLKVLNRWLEVGEWDLIHFNWGLWDLCYRDRDSGKRGSRDKVNGTLTETPEQYGKNLEQIVAQLLETKAKLIWCATTPVPAGEAGRFEGDAIKYNQVAETIMNRHEIPINDLHAHALLKLPGISKQSGDVHFTPEGYAFLAEKVAAAIQEQLSLP